MNARGSSEPLPAQVTGLDWNDIWQAFLHDVDFRAVAAHVAGSRILAHYVH